MARSIKMHCYSSLWGRMYRHFHFIDGVRTTERNYDQVLIDRTAKYGEAKRKDDKGSTWFRETFTWEVHD